ncbi:hypothetical protein LTR37_008057 [Vermiconidia calcicola]|uniref:Uncharacterized protein n=1 Tax=Vermiconidia calcicola TaxID=1690605 RepID=A0ACC3NBV8_9PEZI|nr:hypothetical protein LTR37_008057 [Vermiconidia calcicola]
MSRPAGLSASKFAPNKASDKTANAGSTPTTNTGISFGKPSTPNSGLSPFAASFSNTPTPNSSNTGSTFSKPAGSSVSGGSMFGAPGKENVGPSNGFTFGSGDGTNGTSNGIKGSTSTGGDEPKDIFGQPKWTAHGSSSSVNDTTSSTPPSAASDSPHPPHVGIKLPMGTSSPATTATSSLARQSDPPTIPVSNRDIMVVDPPPRPRKNLRLEAVFLVGTSSTLPDFSINVVLLQNTGEGTFFSIRNLAAGIVQGCSAQALKTYLEAFPRSQVEEGMKWLVKGQHPVLFYAAERNCVDCVRLLLDYGCDANAYDLNGVPTLAYAIMRGKSTVVNPAEVVRMLLAFGATPHCIPSNMWMRYLDGPSVEPLADNSNEPAAKWCTARYRKILVSTLNLSIRYSLHKAANTSVNRERRKQLAQADGYTALLKMPYFIIGQDYATKQVGNVVATHISMKQKAPLVLVFAGLSGHGKTELAKQMGSLLNIPMTVIDCAQMHSGTALFGSRLGYAGNAHGSQLNNHLADNSGMRSVVFMDEFDKTDKEVHNSLLLVLDSGEYHDRRNNNYIDCRKTIWIMATNLGDQDITSFYRDYLEDETPDAKAKVQYDELTDNLKGRFRDTFGAPMAGRMRNVAPFFPFDPNEQAVVVHKFLMELVEQVRVPVSTSALTAHYPGHVHLAIKNDGKLCAHLAGKSYIEELGARSLVSAIDDVRIAFFTAFTDTDELVDEVMNLGPLMKFVVQMQPITKGDGSGTALSKVGVAMDGFSEYYRGQDTGDGRDDTDGEADMDELVEELGRMGGDEPGCDGDGR